MDMEPAVEIIGPHPFARDEKGNLRVRIATLFTVERVLWTAWPPFHMGQREGYIQDLNARRAAAGHPPMTFGEEEALHLSTVDLIIEPDAVEIRPDPERMDLAFAADELLQTIVSKREIRYLRVNLKAVHDAIEERGELWRIGTVPKSLEERHKLIFGSRVALFGDAIYFYNAITGTRWLTYETFARLGAKDDVTLAGYLQEIADHCTRQNRLGRPELDFFAVDVGSFGANRFEKITFRELPPTELRERYERLKDHFHSATFEPFRVDDAQLKPWFQRMFQALFLEGNETLNSDLQEGFGDEFRLEVEWRPGGRFEEGEFLVDSIFEEARENPGNPVLQELCDPRVKPIIFNLLREYSDVKYINVARVPNSLSQRKEQKRGRRGVYIVVFRSRSEPKPIKRFLRLQKWGVWEHLDEKKDLLTSIMESDEYTEFWLDRRLGCRQLGMNLTGRVVMRRLREPYTGENVQFAKQPIYTTYFEREFLEGIATDKLPVDRYTRPGYAICLATLLGRAAVASIIVGRSLEEGKKPVFDDGDEVIVEDASGLPACLYVGDHSGAFGEWEKPLLEYASYYAKPVNLRDKYFTQAREFAEAYLVAFAKQFEHVQKDYRLRRRAFDAMFKHTHYDPKGSFSYRWEQVLRRLDQTDLDQLVAEIRRHIWVLGVR